MTRFLRNLGWIIGSALLVHCGGTTTPPACSATDAGSPDFQCAGVAAVTLTKLQGDLLGPTCAIAGCHDGSPTTLSPTDYSSATKTAGNVGKASTYANSSDPIKVVDASNLTNSTMWLKVLGGSPTYKSVNCTGVGPLMPSAGTQLPQNYLLEIKGWICAGAQNN